ncbi:MAG: hypothetical protein HYX59_09200 [Elusimicrobia bacterium]|nr:hypothetical protein [Elusimicrobiota bacterium]
MKGEPFGKDRQAELLLKGEWHLAAQQRFPEAVHASLTLQYLTISRAELAAYAEKNPVLAEEYFERMQTRDSSKLHDVCVIWRSDGVFKVAMVDHGTPRGVTAYAFVSQAVADHISTVCSLRS